MAQQLARHVSITTGVKQGPMLSKAMTNLKDPVFNQPMRPVRMYFDKEDSIKIKAVATNGKKNVKVMDDFDYVIET
jgi:hypothetical protein